MTKPKYHAQNLFFFPSLIKVIYNSHIFYSFFFAFSFFFTNKKKTYPYIMASTATDRVSQIVNHLAQVTPSLKDKVCIVTGAGSTHGIG